MQHKFLLDNITPFETSVVPEVNAIVHISSSEVSGKMLSNWCAVLISISSKFITDMLFIFKFKRAISVIMVFISYFEHNIFNSSELKLGSASTAIPPETTIPKYATAHI